MIPEKIKESFKNKRCLVTGGTGMIGSQVVEKLLSYGAYVTSASLDKQDSKEASRYSHEYVDLTDICICEDITEGQDYVFNVAGIKASPVITKERPASFFVPLNQMNTNILEASRKNGVKNLIYTSSIGAYSNYINVEVGSESIRRRCEYFKESDYDMDTYPMDSAPGWAKRMGEYQIQLYREEYDLRYSVVRLGNCFSYDTNVMTPNGIRNIREFEIGDKIYTLNPKTFEIEEDIVVDTIINHDKESIIIQNKSGLDWETTKDHNLFLNCNNSKFKFIKADKLYTDSLKRNHIQRYLTTHKSYKNGLSEYQFDYLDYIDKDHFICVKAKKRGSRYNKRLIEWNFKAHNGKVFYYSIKRKDLSKEVYAEFLELYGDDIFIKDFIYGSNYVKRFVNIKYLIQLLAWYISEGNVSEPHNNSFQIVISQSLINKKNRDSIIKSILDSNFICSKGKKSITFNSRLFKNIISSYCGFYSNNKAIPYFIFDLSYKLRKLFFNTLMKGDGDKKGGRYTTNSSKLAKDVCKLLFLNGEQPLLRFDGNCYRVLIRKVNKKRVIKKHHISKKEYNTEKKFYCITAKKNHIIFAGKNGFMGWIGQCYGERDNFDPNNAMVIPSLMAKINRYIESTVAPDPIKVFGDGKAIRDFVYSGDIANGIILAMYHGTGDGFYNLGGGKEVTIKELVEALKTFISFEYQFTETNSGYSKRILDTTLAKEKLNWQPEISLKKGLFKTWEWYIENIDQTNKRHNYFKRKE